MPNSVPVLVDLDTPVIFLESAVNAAPLLLDFDGVAFTDPDDNFDGGTLTVSGLLAEDTVAIRNQGTGAGQIGVSGGDVTYEGIVIGTVAGGAGTTLTVTFDADATAAAIQALIGNLTYANLSDTPTASRTLELKVSDDAGFAAIAAITMVQRHGSFNPLVGFDVRLQSNLSFADLDGDGDLDAVEGEFSGTLDYFRNNGSAAAPDFANQAGVVNPFAGVDVGSRSTLSLADLDGDGDLDAVVGENDGVLHYFRNNGSAAAPDFADQTGVVNPLAGVDVGFLSTPSFVDLDGDGDLDAVVGEEDGTLNYFRNNGSAAAPDFANQAGVVNPFAGVAVDLNSAPSFADLDGDGDLDAAVGQADGLLHYFRNTGTAAAPDFADQAGVVNPFAGVDMGVNSTPSFADLDGDGDLDAVVGGTFGDPNFFENTTPKPITPDFVLETGAANPFDGVAVGFPSTPSFADLDGDGDLDAVVGGADGILNYFRNNGTAAAPDFADQTGVVNPFAGVDVGDDSTPSFADLDGDGDLDAVVGEQDGTLSYLRNNGTAIAPDFADQTGVVNPFAGVDVGFSSAPSLVDLDGDGDLDGVVGENTGIFNYFRNNGTAAAPDFADQTGVVNPFAGVDVGFESTPNFADLDRDGDLDAVVGEQDGTLNYFRNNGTAAAPDFVDQTGVVNPFFGVAAGFNIAPSFADLDGDGDLDAVVGNNDGILNYLRNTGSGFEVVINVTAEDDAGVAAADAFATDEETILVVTGAGTVFANNGSGADTDPDSQLTVIAVNGAAPSFGTEITLPSGAKLTFNSDGTFSYDPNGAFDDLPGPGSGASNLTATDSFTYTLTGGSTAAVTVTISGVDSDGDRLFGITGVNDTFAGGIGGDWYFVRDPGDTINEPTGQGGIDRAFSRGDHELSAGAEIEIFSTDNHAGTGSIKLNGNELDNQIYGNAGDNWLNGLGGADTLRGLAGNDTLLGGSGSDVLIGDDGDDRLYGEEGADTFDGRAGDDWYVVDNAGDVVIEAAGQGTLDRVLASASYTLTAGAEIEVFSTDNHAGTGAIDLTGNALGNLIYGNAGSNVVNGGRGNDVLVGLGGADVFLFDTALNAAANVDRISDFNVAADTIRLDDTIFTALAQGPLAASAFVTGAAAGDANDRIIYNSATGALIYDANGSAPAGATQFAILAAGLSLTNADFVVV